MSEERPLYDGNLSSEEGLVPWLESYAEEEQIFNCQVCGKLHRANGQSFVLIAGNVMIGTNGGLIGNMFKGTTLVHVNVYCRTEACIGKILRDLYRDCVIPGGEPFP